MGKICTHVTPKCANCGAKHQATAFRCPARLKAQAEVWKAKDKELATFATPEEEVEPSSSEMEVDTVGSAAILCLHNAPAVEVMHVSLVPCLISPTSHYSASHLSRVSSVPCLTYSAAYLFNVSHIPCLKI